MSKAAFAETIIAIIINQYLDLISYFAFFACVTSFSSIPYCRISENAAAALTTQPPRLDTKLKEKCLDIGPLEPSLGGPV